ncbi:MAG TPA: winged helix-turn-helix domain-containing protein [Steroidobacteraceae bacterium]|nr:winged helix-turn-helix domain-containing protein [Steroidobacteraceae bacterium]
MSQPAQPVTYEFDRFRVDATQRLLRSRADGEPIPLTSKAFETLLYLVEHPGQLVDKTELMQAVWPNVVVEENNLNQSISAVRRALGESALEHRFIVTVPGRGYRFVAPVKTLSNPGQEDPIVSQPTDAAPAVAPPGTGPSAPASSERPLASLKSRRAAILASAIVLVAAGAWFLWQSFADRTPAPRVAEDSATPPPAAGKQRLAVLPFENLSPDPANAFFTDGLHEEILSTLARRAPGLDVISRTTMMGYRVAPRPVQQVARELTASHVLEGSVRREQNKVRLTLQLIDARNDRHLWSQNYDRTLSDALTLQSEVANEVASQLSVQLVSRPSHAAAAPSNPEAYDLYLKGLLARQFVGPLAPIEKFRDVEELFSRVIELDPGFAPAYAQRSTFRGAMFAFNYDTSEAQVRRIREDVDAGLKLAPDDPETLASEALYWSWVERDLPRALATFEAAETAGLADTMFMGGKSITLTRLGRIDDALRMDRRLMALDPGNPFILGSAVANLYLARKPEEAMRAVKRALEQFPGGLPLEFVRGQLIFGYTGRADEWRATLDRTSQLLPAAVLVDQHFNLLRMEGRYAELKTVLDGIAEPSVRVIAGTGASSLFGVGHRPTALYRGWAALLLNDTAAAARHGREVLQFVTNQKETGRNQWFLRLLQLQGHTFLGNREAAMAAGRDALQLMPATRDALSWLPTAAGVAAAYAWSGAEDEAVALLEEYSSATPGPGPALITRDPLFSVPLGRNERYRALASRLEAQMRSTKL